MGRRRMAKIGFTAGRVVGFKCPDSKEQAFLWDSGAPGLGVRATPAGKPSYIFQGLFKGKTLRMTIGSPSAWSIPEAQLRARELQRQIDEGRDPRAVTRERTAADAATREREKLDALIFGDVWTRYLTERKPYWSTRHFDDHQAMMQAGGQPRDRRQGVSTVPGPLAALSHLRLSGLDGPTLEAWAIREAKTRPARVRLALRLLKAFLRWAHAEPDLKGRVDPTAASAKKTREAAGKAGAKNDNIQRDQLRMWFSHVQAIQNPVIAGYLQCLLLTGARREELAALKWEDVDFQWRSMDIRDKIDGRRSVPLTPFVSQLLAQMPRANDFVFSAARFVASVGGAPGHWVNTSKSGHIAEPSIAHRKACKAAGLEGLTLHGLRRSFASLCEWLDIPGGISAQIQGHAPQGTREQNYIRRPLDLLRMHHEKIEAWMLSEAQVPFDPKVTADIKKAKRETGA